MPTDRHRVATRFRLSGPAGFAGAAARSPLPARPARRRDGRDDHHREPDEAGQLRKRVRPELQVRVSVPHLPHQLDGRAREGDGERAATGRMPRRPRGGEEQHPDAHVEDQMHGGQMSHHFTAGLGLDLGPDEPVPDRVDAQADDLDDHRRPDPGPSPVQG